MGELLSNPDVWVSFLTLVLMEIVLGVDNIIFISILTGKLEKSKQASTRFIGLSLALAMRVLLLLLIGWIVSLRCPLFELPFHIPGAHVALDASCGVNPEGHPVSGRDLILIIGGLFLVFKTGYELYLKLTKVETDHVDAEGKRIYPSVVSIFLQIILVDIIFSFDSILTAVGLVDDVRIMIAAVVVSMIFMMVASKWVSDFIDKYPGIKIIALAFLVMIGLYLFLEGFHWEFFKKEYLYFSLLFALICEALIIRYRRLTKQ
ncbi:MAG: TerC family protein [Flavobacteriales bacterium]|nr:TerC family protein [Flavobacteriales bacterium]